MAAVNIRPLISVNDLDAIVHLQQKIWGYSELETEGRAVLTVASRFSGQLLGAFSNSTIVGFSLAFAGLEKGSLHSHRVGVLPQFQNAGIGRALKLAQRHDALENGFQTIHWTFDPCMPRNAYLNLQKLGGCSRTYLPNLYGTTSSPLHGGIPTDRLVIDWILESPRVLSALNGKPVLPSNKALRVPFRKQMGLEPRAAQQALREHLQDAFSRGYTVTNFERRGEGGDYILELL